MAEWLACADEDLTLARHALSLGEQCPHRLVAYHAQQCAEKHLKAYLVWRNVDFPYTHNLRALLELCAEHAPELAAGLDEATTLTPYATTLRYPGVLEPVGHQDAVEALRVASRVQQAVRAQLDAEGYRTPEAPSSAPGEDPSNPT